MDLAVCCALISIVAGGGWFALRESDSSATLRRTSQELSSSIANQAALAAITNGTITVRYVPNKRTVQFERQAQDGNPTHQAPPLSIPTGITLTSASAAPDGELLILRPGGTISPARIVLEDRRRRQCLITIALRGSISQHCTEP